MKRSLLALFFVAAVLSACEKPEPQPVIPVVEKTVKFKVFAAEDYSAPIYNNVEATVTIAIGIVPKSTDVFTKTWDTVITKSIKEFPALQQAIAVEKKFNVKEASEQLQVAYSIRYVDNGQISQSAYFESLPDGVSTFMKDIDL